MLRKAILALALAWAGYAAVREVSAAVLGYRHRATRLESAITWRPGMPQVETLARFIAAARPLLPPGSIVVLASGEDDQGFFRYRWAAYLLPEFDLIPINHPARSEGQYLLAYRQKIDHPRLEQIRRLPAGRLYRILPPPGP